MEGAAVIRRLAAPEPGPPQQEKGQGRQEGEQQQQDGNGPERHQHGGEIQGSIQLDAPQEHARGGAEEREAKKDPGVLLHKDPTFHIGWKRPGRDKSPFPGAEE